MSEYLQQQIDTAEQVVGQKKAAYMQALSELIDAKNYLGTLEQVQRNLGAVAIMEAEL